jgi:predicted nucleic acid-binding protein
VAATSAGGATAVKAHIAPCPGALVAAAAAEQGFGVLHYDRHFDRLATVLGFASRRVGPPGTLD